MFPYINIYFYRIDHESPRNVIGSWGGCVAVPRPGDVVALGEGNDLYNWIVEKVAWSRPAERGGPQVVDILVSIPPSELTHGVALRDTGVPRRQACPAPYHPRRNP